MRRYFFKKLLLQAVIGVPSPRVVNRALRFYVDTKAGENFGDMRINGELRFLERHAPDCRVLVDVGAHDGVWTAHVLRLNPRASVHCFEPVHAHTERLRARGFPPQVVVNAAALSDAEGRAEIFTASLSLHDRRGPGVHGAHEGASETVERTTLDAYCASRAIEAIDLVKIDAEGHDLAVLRGAASLVRAGRIRRIQFEYGPRNVYARVFLRDFFVFFEGLPYQLYQVMPRGLVPVAYTHRLENLQYKNFVALHDSVVA